MASTPVSCADGSLDSAAGEPAAEPDDALSSAIVHRAAARAKSALLEGDVHRAAHAGDEREQRRLLGRKDALGDDLAVALGCLS